MIILTPVDFSKCAGNALKYASGLAELAKAKLLLHHVYTEEDEGLDRTRANEIKKSLAVFYTGYGNKYPEVELNVQESPDITGLAYHPLIKQIDFIVMGTKGASPLKSVFVGSNTVKLMDSITKPLIVVPEGSNIPEKGKPILLLTDYNPTENLHVFDPLLNLAKLLNSEIVILHVKKQGARYEMYQVVEKNRMEIYFDEKVKHRRETAFHGDLENGVNTYLRENNYQMICMIHHEHSVIDNLFKRNQTHEMAFHSNTPLLILNKRDVYSRN
ncbi:MAG: universal stress protein [Flavobacteriales bacterium]